MTNSIKISFGICLTASFITLISLITVSDLVTGGKAGVDIGAFVAYSHAMLNVSTANVREPKNPRQFVKKTKK